MIYVISIRTCVLKQKYEIIGTSVTNHVKIDICPSEITYYINDKDIIMIKIVNPVYWKIKRKILTWLHPNLTIGYGTMVIGWPKITGSGRIYIGKNCRLIKPKLKYHGVLRIGDNCFLNYTSIVTKLNIDIDDWTIISDAYIVDTDFHNIHPLERHKPCTGQVQPDTFFREFS